MCTNLVWSDLSRRLFEQLQNVAVGIEESGDPTAPLFLRRGFEKRHALGAKRGVYAMDVIHPQVDHDTIRVPRWSTNPRVLAEAQPHIAPAERDEMRPYGVRREL